MDKQEEKNNQLLNPDEMFDALITKIKETCPGMDLVRIRAAYEMALLSHSCQLRKEFSPYVTHF
ncbi:MAG: hypothetical protein SPF74_09745, partial [Candidatus Limivicinus sp.]|nr:hypothetical protein [Candidatus Limivicinus sp.]